MPRRPAAAAPSVADPKARFGDPFARRRKDCSSRPIARGRQRGAAIACPAAAVFAQQMLAPARVAFGRGEEAGAATTEGAFERLIGPRSVAWSQTGSIWPALSADVFITAGRGRGDKRPVRNRRPWPIPVSVHSVAAGPCTPSSKRPRGYRPRDCAGRADRELPTKRSCARRRGRAQASIRAIPYAAAP